MYVIILCILILIFSIILIKLLNQYKNYIMSIFITIMIVLFIMNLKISINSIIDGCKLCFYAIIPTIFPFSVICNLLICYDGISLYSKIIGPLLCKPLGLSKNSSFAIAASFICGYPLGSKYSTDIYELGYINKSEYIRLLNIATNCGPVFILGAISTSLLNNINYGYILLISNYLSVIIIGIISKNNKTPSSKYKSIPLTKQRTFSDNLKDAISNAINTTLTVSGFIIVFSLIIGIIKNNATISIVLSTIESSIHIPKGILSSLFLGSIEITNGCNLISISTFGLHLKLSLISFLCSFSGLSIIAQSSSFISKHNISMLRYSLIKLLQGIISFFITFFISYYFNDTITSSSLINTDYHMINYNYIVIPILTLLVLYIINKIFKDNLFHIS